MKKLLLTLAATSLAATLHAAPPAVDVVALKSYASRALPRCPGSTLTLEPLDQAGPMNFVIYVAKLISSDQYCSSQKYVLYSPVTQQVLLGSVILLPNDNRPVHLRVSQQATELLKQTITATVAPFPLPDGLKTVAMTRKTDYGPFSYHGFVDASERFLIVGQRGNLRTSPGDSIRESLGIESGARRGTRAAKVEIIELSDFECPTCGRAHKRLEPLFAKNLSKINFIRLDLPLFEHHKWAVQAALGGRAIQSIAPKKYWQYVDWVFSNQELIGTLKFDNVLKDFCEDHDINWPAVETIYRSKTEQQAIMDQVSRAFDLGIVSTPTFIVNGQVLGFGPDGDFTFDTIQAAVGVKPAVKPATKPTPKPAAKPAAKKK